MCFVARCAYAFVFQVLVFKVLEHVATLYFGVSSELQRCKRPCAVKMYALALKRVVTLKVHYFTRNRRCINAETHWFRLDQRLIKLQIGSIRWR